MSAAVAGGGGRTGRLYVRVGALILAGAALAVGFVLFFSAGRLNNDAQVLETYSRESVQGLSVGASVRYRGVEIGRVTEITLANAVYRRPEGTPFQGAFQLVVVRFAVDTHRLGNETPSTARAVELGLRARLSTTGITGVGYIELDFVDPERFPAETPPWQPANPLIPAVPSTVAQVQDAAQRLVMRLEQVPLEAILTDVAGILSDLRRQTAANGDISQVVAEAADLLRTLRETAGKADVPGLVGDLRGAVADLRGTVGGPDVRATLRSVREAAEGARQAMNKLPDAVAALERTARAAGGTTANVNADLGPILRDLRATASNLRDTTDLLRRAPSQAILGAPPPPPDWAARNR